MSTNKGEKKDCCLDCIGVIKKDGYLYTKCSNGKCSCHCEHELKLEKKLVNTHLCIECKENLVVHEIEIFNEFHEVAGFCDNEKCKRYLLLVI